MPTSRLELVSGLPRKRQPQYREGRLLKTEYIVILPVAQKAPFIDLKKVVIKPYPVDSVEVPGNAASTASRCFKELCVLCRRCDWAIKR